MVQQRIWRGEAAIPEKMNNALGRGTKRSKSGG